MKEQLQVAIALLIAKGGMDDVVSMLDIRLEQLEYVMEVDENGQLSLPATAVMKDQSVRNFRGTIEKCKTGLNTKVTLDGNVFYVPTGLLNARGLERAIIELRKTAQEGMKPRWDTLLKSLNN